MNFDQVESASGLFFESRILSLVNPTRVRTPQPLCPPGAVVVVEAADLRVLRVLLAILGPGEPTEDYITLTLENSKVIYSKIFVSKACYPVFAVIFSFFISLIFFLLYIFQMHFHILVQITPPPPFKHQ